METNLTINAQDLRETTEKKRSEFSEFLLKSEKINSLPSGAEKMPLDFSKKRSSKHNTKERSSINNAR